MILRQIGVVVYQHIEKSKNVFYLSGWFLYMVHCCLIMFLSMCTYWWYSINCICATWILHKIQTEASISFYDADKVLKVEDLVCEKVGGMEYLHLLIPHKIQWIETWFECYVTLRKRCSCWLYMCMFNLSNYMWT
jgi:hypothetical protein